MPPIVWAATLPQEVEVDGYVESLPDLALRSQPDVGPAKLRRRCTSNVRPFTCTMHGLTDSEATALDTFYITTTLGGTLAFEFPHPRLGTVDVVFAGPPPQLTPDPTGTSWNATLSLEVVP